ncbi:hypothetical protein PBF_00010 [Cytobacillus firmus DS1]|uniref:Uncharacterized protein n=1 Tax=Cytobacillus firmus DS1 TaxID=1307436 RepID=W7LC48_CYTFI|nr:hypothetical protein PBF_00010 [Cytobacillus firmus DS1]
MMEGTHRAGKQITKFAYRIIEFIDYFITAANLTAFFLHLLLSFFFKNKLVIQVHALILGICILYLRHSFSQKD